MSAPVLEKPAIRARPTRAVPDLLVLTLVPLAISCLMLWPALVGQGVFAPTDIVAYEALVATREPGYHVGDPANPFMVDVVDTFVPWKLLAREQIYSGRFPLWNPYNALGTPLHANLQSEVLSPFNLLWYLLPPMWGLGALAALKWTLAGVGMGLLLRRLGLALPASLFGAVAFQLSGPITVWLQWPLADGLLWVPWMIWAALGWLDTLGPIWLTALTGFVAAEWLAGHIETSFHSTVFFGAVALAGWASANFAGRQRWLALGGLVAAEALGLALSAAALLPFAAILPASYQWWLRSQVDTAGLALPLNAALLWLSPNGYGWANAYTGPRNPIEADPYVGAITLLLAAVAIALYVPRLAGWGWKYAVRLLSPRLPWLWLMLLAASASMAYGIPPLSLLRELPGFSSSFNWRLISVAGACAVVLAAMGLDSLVRWNAHGKEGRGPELAKGQEPAESRQLLVAAVVAAVGVVGFGITGLRVWTVSSKPAGPYMEAWKAWAGALFCLGALLILLRIGGWLRPVVFAYLVVGLLAVDMVRATWGFNPTLPESTFYPPSPLLTFAAQKGPTERTAVVGGYALANMLAPYHVPEFSLYDATIDNRYLEYSRLMSPETFRESFKRQDPALTSHLVLLRPSAALLSAVGIRWVLAANKDDPNSWQPVPSGGPIYKKTLTKNGFSVWENLYARPYTYLATRYHLIRPAGDKDTAAQARERMQSLALDTVDVVQVEDPSGRFPQGVGASNTGNPVRADETASLESYAPGEIRVRVKADAPRLLVISEGWTSDWKVYIDGKPAAIYRTNYMIQGVPVPAGEHEVRLAYEPDSFAWGVGISSAALLVWVGSAALFVVRRVKDRNEG